MRFSKETVLLRGTPAFARLAACCALVSCGSRAQKPVSRGPYPAPHADLPTVQAGRGPVLAFPNVIPVFFTDDAFQASIERFLSALAASSFWTETTMEYGVGPLHVAPSVVLPEALPSAGARADVLAWLSGYLDGSHPEWPAIDANNVYVVFFPPSATISDDIGTSCVDYEGYHSEGVQGPSSEGDAGAAGASGASFVYVIIPECPRFAHLSGIDAITGSLSHELVEAATNPFVRTAPAFFGVDDTHRAWSFVGTGDSEVGDMCNWAESPERLYRRMVGDFVVQRTWSNRAASAKQDPCIPAVKEAYFSAAPDFRENVKIGPFATATTPGARLAIGESTTVDVRLFSTGATLDWYVEAAEVAPSFSALVTLAAPAQPALSFTWDKQLGNNGDTVKLTITRRSAGGFGGNGFLIYSSAPNPDPQSGRPSLGWNTWAGFVSN